MGLLSAGRLYPPGTLVAEKEVMLSPAQLENLQAAAEAAVACETKTEVPAELTVAQWALESGWGTHQPGNNCFGIKPYPGCFAAQTLETIEVIGNVQVKEQQSFAVFPSVLACFEEHARLICGGRSYQQAWARYLASRDVPELVNSAAKVYATDPGYGVKLTGLLQMPAVSVAIAAARRKGGDQSGQRT